MKFFALESSLDKKIMGKIPQIKEFTHHCNIDEEPNHIDRYIFEKVNIKPILSNVVLYSNSNKTDFINTYGHIGFLSGFLISNKFKEILDKFNCYGFQFFETYIIHKNNKINNYWQANKYEFPYEHIDFLKTSFIYKDRDLNRNTVSEKINFKSLEEFLLFASKIRYPKQLFFEDFHFREDMNLDFFSLQYDESANKAIVSERLKIEIEKNNITGIEFRPIELSLQKWYNSEERGKIYGKI